MLSTHEDSEEHPQLMSQDGSLLPQRDGALSLFDSMKIVGDDHLSWLVERLSFLKQARQTVLQFFRLHRLIKKSVDQIFGSIGSLFVFLAGQQNDSYMG